MACIVVASLGLVEAVVVVERLGFAEVGRSHESDGVGSLQIICSHFSLEEGYSKMRS